MADLLDWAARAGAGATVDLVCHEADEAVVPSAEGAMVVRLTGCLGAAPLALPYELLGLGVAAVEVRLDTCSDPDADRWSGLVAAFAPERVHLRTGPPETGHPSVEPAPADRMPRLTRRGLLGMFAQPGADEPATSEGTDHQRLRRALASVSVDDEAAARPGPGWVLEAPECEFDAVCAQSCPEDALVVERRGARSSLVLDPGACTACGLCLQVCPTEALRVIGPNTWASLVDSGRVEVATGTTRACERCQVQFRARGMQTLCPTCAFRRAHPFASALPDEVRERRRFGG